MSDKLITEAQAARIITLLERIAPFADKLDEIAEVLPIIETLGDVIVFRKHEVDEAIGLNKQTLWKSKKTYEEVGHRKVYVNLETVSVYNSKKKKGKK